MLEKMQGMIHVKGSTDPRDFKPSPELLESFLVWIESQDEEGTLDRIEDIGVLCFAADDNGLLAAVTNSLSKTPRFNAVMRRLHTWRQANQERSRERSMTYDRRINDIRHARWDAHYAAKKVAP